MEEEKMEADIPPQESIFPGKSKLCLICACDVLSAYHSNLDLNEDKQELFLKGLAIFCKIGNLDAKYGRAEFWELCGLDMSDIVESVCCSECFKLIKSLVTFSELIAATKISLAENVQKLKKSVVESERNGDAEFSINSCFQFRAELLSCDEIGVKPRTGRRTGGGGPASKTGRLSQHSGYSEDKKLNDQCWVELKKINNSEGPVCHFDDEEEIHITNIGQGQIRRRRKNVDDEDFNPRKRIRRGHGHGKRGRPRKHPLVKKVKRPRGRPRMNLVIEKVKTKNSSDDKADESRTSRDSWSSQPSPSGSRSSGFDVNTYKEGLSEDEKYQPPIKQLNRQDDLASKPVNKKVKFAMGRPPKDSRSITLAQAKSLVIGEVRLADERSSCPYYKPTLVVDHDNNLYTYYNIRCQRVDDTLLCKYPGCGFVAGGIKYFSDQIAFRNFRLHVKHIHRLHGVKKKDRDDAEDPDDPEEKPEDYHYCGYCEDQFPTKRNLLEHTIISHSDAEPLPAFCEVCGNSMPQNSIIDHLCTHKSSEEAAIAREVIEGQLRGKKKGRFDVSMPLDFPCDECDVVCKNQTLLNGHKKSHIPIEVRKQYQCDHCGIRLSSPHTLRSHVERVHLGIFEYPYVCNICNQKFNNIQKTKYEVHMRLHSGERPFECSDCGKTFRDKYRLKVHERLHLGVRIQCEFCSNSYRTPKGLRVHHTKHHPDHAKRPKVTNRVVEEIIGPKLMHPCEPCGKIYIYKSQLISHMKHRHKLFLPTSQEYPEQNTFEMQQMRDRGYIN